MDTINSVILHGETSSTFVQLQLATIVQKRLEASQGTSSSGASKVSYLEAWQVDGKSLRRLAQLGTGSSAAVYKAKWFEVIEVAEKVFGVPRNDSFDQEMSLLAELSHPNIVSTLGYWADEHSCSIVTELMDGDLFCLMENPPREEVGLGPFSILVACDIMLQVAQGMAYIHDKGVVHRDLKSHNIMFRRSQDDDIEYICVKVGDFGISKTKERSFLCTHQTSNTGLARSIAPELIELQGEKKKVQSSFHPYKSDVYSFGMLCFEILTRELPFSKIKNTREVKEQVLDGIRPVLPLQCPQELKRLIESCWDSAPKKRPDFPKICEALMGLYFSLLIGTFFSH
jgi:serine/threonine protein kinase